MKIVLKDFYYKGNHFDEFKGEYENINDVEELLANEQTLEWIKNVLDEFLIQFSEENRRGPV